MHKTRPRWLYYSLGGSFGGLLLLLLGTASGQQIHRDGFEAREPQRSEERRVGKECRL